MSGPVLVVLYRCRWCRSYGERRQLRQPSDAKQRCITPATGDAKDTEGKYDDGDDDGSDGDSGGSGDDDDDTTMKTTRTTNDERWRTMTTDDSEDDEDDDWMMTMTTGRWRQRCKDGDEDDAAKAERRQRRQRPGHSSAVRRSSAIVLTDVITRLQFDIELLESGCASLSCGDHGDCLPFSECAELRHGVRAESEPGQDQQPERGEDEEAETDDGWVVHNPDTVTQAYTRQSPLVLKLRSIYTKIN